MKRLALIGLVLVGCSVTTTEQSTTLAPLPTSTTVAELESKPAEQRFFQHLISLSGTIDIELSDGQDILSVGYAWCLLLRNGMTPQDVRDRINEGSASEYESQIMTAIVYSAVEDLCPDQAMNWQEG